MGAVVVKQNMDHLDTLPNLYEAGETHLSVNWDFSGLAGMVTGILNDKPRMTMIACEA